MTIVDFGVLSNDTHDKDQDHEYQPNPPLPSSAFHQYPEPQNMPAVRDPFDPAPLLALFDRYQGQIDGMIATAHSLKVVDDATADQAAEYTTRAKKLAHTLDKKRQEEKAPYLAVTSVLDKRVKSLIDSLAGVQGIINGKLQPYFQEKERVRIEAQRKADAEARALQAKLDAEEAEKRRQASEKARLDALIAGAQVAEAEAAARAAAAMVEPTPVVVARVVADETKTTTDNGTVGLKEKWAFEILNFRELPDECMAARYEEIKKAVSPWIRSQIAAGIYNIPGVKTFKQAVVKTRTK